MTVGGRKCRVTHNSTANDKKDKAARREAVKVLALWAAVTLFLVAGLSFRSAFWREGLLWEVGVMWRRMAEIMLWPARMVVGSWPAEHGASYVVGFIGALVWTLFLYGAGTLPGEIARRLKKRSDRRKAVAGKEAASRDTDGSPVLSRRALLFSAAYGAPAVVLGTTAWTSTVGPQRIRIKAVDFAMKDLPAAMEGLRIAHVSDMHFGRWIGPDYIRRAFRLAMQAKPDLVLLTGDYVTSDPGGFQIVANLINDELRAAPLGVLDVLGNHDHWTDAAVAREVFAAAEIPLIDNQRRFVARDGLHDKPDADAICVGGVGDHWTDAVDFEAATAGAPESMPRIVLPHNPDAAEDYASGATRGTPPRINLMLSGHTHGGQVRVPGLGTPIVPSKFGQKYAAGLVQGPHWPVLVTHGIGMAVLPVRFLVPPEVLLITLRAGH